MNPILAKFQNQVALIEEGHATWLEASLNAVAARMPEIEATMRASDNDFWSENYAWLRPYHVAEGILHIPVKGVLLKDFPYALGNWATGYEYISRAFARGLDDSNVKGIALVINSGGGMVDGNFDLVDRIYNARGTKPIRAYAASHAYSAAYNIASAADTVTVERTGGVGSIGVVCTQVEFSKMLEDAGIKINLVRSKPDKMEGNPYEPLSEGARDRLQAVVDELHSQFVASVARNRGLSEAKVDKTDAHTFMPQKAIEIGLADSVGALDDAITAFAATISEGENQMAEQNQAELDAAVSAARAEGKAEGIAEGASAAMARINGIIGSDAAAKRPQAALNAALKTGMAVEEATAFLATLPEEKTAQNATPGAGAPEGMFRSAMEGSQNPNVGAEDGEEDKKMSRAQRTLTLVAN